MPFGLFLNLSAQQELKEYGVKTHGTITKAWLWVRRSRTDVWSVQATYKVGDKIYRTSTKENPEKSLFKGDTVMVIYATKTPELSEIIALIDP